MITGIRARLIQVAVQLALREARRSNDDDTAIRRYSNLADSARKLGDYATALIGIDELIRIGTRDNAAETIRRALPRLFDEQGQLLWHLERVDEAVLAATRSLELREAEALWPDSNPADLAIALDHLAIKVRAVGYLDQALTLHNRSVQIWRSQLKTSSDYLPFLRHAISLRNQTRRLQTSERIPGEIYEDVVRRILKQGRSAAQDVSTLAQLRMEAPAVLVTGLGYRGMGYALPAAEAASKLGAAVMLTGTAKEAHDFLSRPGTEFPSLLVIATTPSFLHIGRPETVALGELIDLLSSAQCKLLCIGNEVAARQLSLLLPDRSTDAFESADLLHAGDPVTFAASLFRYFELLLAHRSDVRLPREAVLELSEEASTQLRMESFADLFGDLDEYSGNPEDTQAQLSDSPLEEDWREYYLLGLAYAKGTGTYADAERELVEALQAAPVEFAGRCLLALAKVQSKRGRLTECLASLRGATDTAEAHAAYLMLGHLLGSRGWLTEAIDAYDNALHIEPGRAETHFWRSQALFKVGRVSEADSSYHMACELDSFYAIRASREIVYGGWLDEKWHRVRPFRFRDWSPELNEAPSQRVHKSPDLLPPSSGMKIGVVLGGGGGKGAFQAGFLSAIDSSSEIEVVSISGASIGALNAAAYSSRGSDAVIGLWNSLTSRSVVGASLKSLRLLPAVALVLVMYLLEIVSYNLPWVLLIARYMFRRKWAITVLKDIALPWLLFRAIGAWRRVDGSILRQQTRLLSEASVSETRGVVAILESALLADWSPRIPTFCTITDYRRVFNPDAPYFHQFFIYGWYSELSARSCGMVGWFPRYVDLATLPSSELVNTLVRSSALPMVFPLVGRKGAFYSIDGGLADNVPIVPLADLGLDAIVVVQLGRRRRLSVDRTSLEAEVRDRLLLDTPTAVLFDRWERWARREGRPRLRDERFLVSENLPFESGRRNTRDRHLMPNRFVPRRQGPPLMPKIELPPVPPILVWEPKLDLGGFFSGTLNFRHRKIESLVRQGRSEGLLACERLLRMRGGDLETSASEAQQERPWLGMMVRAAVTAFKLVSPRQYVGVPTERAGRILERFLRREFRSPDESLSPGDRQHLLPVEGSESG